MKVREVDVTWRTSVGVANGEETYRGFVQRLPANQAKQYYAQGLCEMAKVPLDELGPAYQIDEARVKMGAELMAEAAKQPKPLEAQFPSILAERRW